MGVCGNCKKICGHRRKSCQSSKAVVGGGGNGKHCDHCNKDGHTESDYWMKNPVKVPEWYKKLTGKSEASSDVSIDDVVISTPDPAASLFPVSSLYHSGTFTGFFIQ